jgi:septum formation protein
MNDDLSVYQNVLNVSKEKAEAVFCDNKDACVLGCDTIVVLNNKIYGKPKDKNDAFNTLRLLSGKTHSVISGVCIITPNKTVQYYVESFVTFKELSDKDILDYIETGEPMDKAGSYAIQGIGAKLIDHYTGSFENIVGLPIDEVTKTLNEVLE